MPARNPHPLNWWKPEAVFEVLEQRGHVAAANDLREIYRGMPKALSPEVSAAQLPEQHPNGGRVETIGATSDVPR